MRATRTVSLGALLLLAGLGCAPLPFDPPSGRAGIDDSGDIVLAEVAGRAITARELERRVLERYYGPRALLGLVREALFLEEARILGVEVTDEELAAQVGEELRAVLGSTPMEREASLERLRFQGLEIEDVQEELRQELRGMLLIQKVVAAHRPITEETLREAYDSTWSAERRRVRHIAFPLRGDPGDEAAVAQVATRANSVRQAILSGASFAESARTFSGNPETGARGGEIGWLSREELGSKDLAEFVFALEVGKISPLYREGEYGFHLFQVIDERPVKPFDEVRAELEAELLGAPPTDDEILQLESELRRRIPVRVRPDVAPPSASGAG